MKVILTTDMPNLGHPMDIVVVKNGYARNFLFPQGLAVPYSSAMAAEIEKMQAEREKQREEVMANAKHYVDQIGKLKLEFSEKASEKGALYGSVNAGMIANRLAEEHKIALDAGDIEIEGGSIKQVGDYAVSVKLGDEVAELGVSVQADSSK